MNIILYITVLVFFFLYIFFVLRKNKYSEKDIVSFGNYLLSKERHNRIVMCKNLPNKEVWEERLVQVSDADIRNWIELENKI